MFKNVSHVQNKIRLQISSDLGFCVCVKRITLCNCLCSSSPFLFIYLLTLFNVDYKILAAYALMKIDYPPPSHKKRNKNVNKSVKEDNWMCKQFFQINLSVRFTYSTWTLFTLSFSNFLFKKVKRRRIFSFFSY